MEEIELRESLDPNYYYDAKLPAIRMAREAGWTDADIEEMFGITLRPQDCQAPK